MLRRSILVSILAVVALAASGGVAVAQPEGAGGGAAPDIRVEKPSDASTDIPSTTRESEIDGSPLGWPLTLGLILVAVLLLGYAPWRVRRATQSRRRTRSRRATV